MMYTKLVGVGFRPKEDRDIAKALKEGDALVLRREPGNEHDANAIQVLSHGTFIGYIPATDAKLLAPKMDAGRPFGAIVTAHDDSAKAQHALEIAEANEDEGDEVDEGDSE